MATTLLVIQIILTLLITIVVLLQKSSSIGLGAYSGSNESMFGAKGPAGFLAKATMVLGLLFLINTIALGYMYNRQTSVVDRIQLPTKGDSNLAPLPTQPTNDTQTKAPDSLNQTLEVQEGSNPFESSAPAAPSAPIDVPTDTK
ncbi:preprotein translocase subunit SecG [uncultured Helicobacter sp.]|uniref:preprotein translocase subunit SecG n=1 Tax=uncultured Helicobacter sp. TaxID=175537 RepID=UPI001C3A718A|nr:preprotein translocase subunit SecG [Candidatus Helicobacter avicola]